MRRVLDPIGYRGARLAFLFASAAVTACTDNTAPGNDRSSAASPETPTASVAPVEIAIEEADRRSIEPSTMTVREYEQVVGGMPDCRFQMTAVGMPILAAREGVGVIKINGKLVELRSPRGNPSEAGQIDLSAGDIRVTVTTLAAERDTSSDRPSRREANLVFSLQGGRTVGYRGYSICRG